MIVWIDYNSINSGGRNERVISDHRPCRRIATAVSRFPYAAANRTDISNDSTINSGSWIDCNRVNSPFGRRVIKTARTTGHPLRLRTESGKIGRTQRVWIGEFKLQMLSRRDAARHPCMLSRGGSHPCGIEAAGRKRQTVVPVLLQLCQTGSFALFFGPRYRHVAFGLRGTWNCDIFSGEYSKRYSGQPKSQSE